MTKMDDILKPSRPSYSFSLPHVMVTVNESEVVILLDHMLCPVPRTFKTPPSTRRGCARGAAPAAAVDAPSREVLRIASMFKKGVSRAAKGD